jgi:hypothetical protein
MISISFIVMMLVIHFLADFSLQTHDQANKKSTDIAHLARHVLTYSLVWLVVSYCIWESVSIALLFAGITYVCHYITDYITSRIGKPFWESGDYHTGFVVVGADQVAHYLQLIYTHHLIQTYLT